MPVDQESRSTSKVVLAEAYRLHSMNPLCGVLRIWIDSKG